MVASALPRLFAVVPYDTSRPVLLEALSHLESGNVIEAAARLREAIRIHLDVLCHYYGCRPVQHGRLRAGQLLAALAKSGHVCGCWCGWLKEILDSCNRACLYHRISEDRIRLGIELLFGLLDESPLPYDGREG